MRQSLLKIKAHVLKYIAFIEIKEFDVTISETVIKFQFYPTHIRSASAWYAV